MSGVKITRGRSQLRTREQQARDRQQRLDAVQRQVEEGKLVIRPMTAQEKKRWTRP